MSGSDASTATDPERSRSGSPGSRWVVDRSAVVGGAVWVALAALDTSGTVALGRVDLFVGLAVLVVVPLGLGLLSPRDRFGRREDDGSRSTALPAAQAFRVAAVGQFPAALAAVVGLGLPAGTAARVVLVLPWLVVTGALAVVGLARLLARGPRPLPALAVDAALLYVPVAGVALVLHAAGISLRFDPLIVLLTAVHFHYAGFALPLVAGVVSRHLTDEAGRFGDGPAGRLTAGALLVIVVNVGLIAVGITFSPLVEVLAVAAFTVAVALFAAVVLRRVVPDLPGVPAALLALAALSLFATMALALAYGYSAYPATGRLVGIERMVTWHGTLNAFGFALPALVACRWLVGEAGHE
ncbi:hypothetical protein BRD00_02935 [Halobacteriales archaeon QS_8_69_26]|nr:MAG: hypothetical protein BRD00_02935 [Halobacteriales archaeon QS_8_69_26]